MIKILRGVAAIALTPVLVMLASLLGKWIVLDGLTFVAHKIFAIDWQAGDVGLLQFALGWWVNSCAGLVAMNIPPSGQRWSLWGIMGLILVLNLCWLIEPVLEQDWVWACIHVGGIVAAAQMAKDIRNSPPED